MILNRLALLCYRPDNKSTALPMPRGVEIFALISPSPNLLHVASSGLESQEFADMQALSNHMGLFLQKTNIIRDYLVRPGASYV